MRTLLLVLLLYTAQSQAVVMIGRHLIVVNQFVYEGQTYNLLTIEGAPGNHPYDYGGDVAWVERVLRGAWHWVIEQYEMQGILKPGTGSHEGFTRRESLLDNRSAVQILLKGDSIKDIVAVMRVARQGHDSERVTSLEARRDRRLSPFLDSLYFVEWKNFVKARGLSKNITALMLREAIKNKFFDNTLFGQKPDYVVGETHPGMINYFMKEYAFDLLDFETEAGRTVNRQEFFEQLRKAPDPQKFLENLKGLFIIAASLPEFKKRMENQIQQREAELGHKLPEVKDVEFQVVSESLLGLVPGCRGILTPPPLFLIKPK